MDFQPSSFTCMLSLDLCLLPDVPQVHQVGKLQFPCLLVWIQVPREHQKIVRLASLRPQEVLPPEI